MDASEDLRLTKEIIYDNTPEACLDCNTPKALAAAQAVLVMNGIRSVNRSINTQLAIAYTCPGYDAEQGCMVEDEAPILEISPSHLAQS